MQPTRKQSRLGTIDFGPIVDICQVPTYVPTDGAQPKGVYGPPLPPISFTMK